MFCPRCNKEEGTKFFEAPQDKSWELYRCRYCDFVWRSTEKEYIKNKDLYPLDFKLTEDHISKMVHRPTIPPLKKLAK
jgi:hypothetical protein